MAPLNPIPEHDPSVASPAHAPQQAAAAMPKKSASYLAVTTCFTGSLEEQSGDDEPTRRHRVRRESVQPLRRAAAAAQHTTRLLLRQFGVELRPGSLAALRAWCGLAGVPPRQVYLNLPAAPKAYADNYVSSAKYTPLTFLPLFLFELLSRVAYVYFLLQAALTWWSEVSPFNPYGGTAALLFVMLVGAIRAGAEDLRRHKEDMHTNNSTTHVVGHDGVVRDVRWSSVRVGQLLCVREGEALPADLLCLASGLDEGVAFVRTGNLDGETNLKTKRPILNLMYHQHQHHKQHTVQASARQDGSSAHVPGVQGSTGDVPGDIPASAGGPGLNQQDRSSDVLVNAGSEGQEQEEQQQEEEEQEGEGQGEDHTQQLESAIQQLSRYSGVLMCEPPSRNMHRFHGSFQLHDISGGHAPRPIPITMNELLLRGSLLRNTGWVLGLVVYCGPDTRIQMNAASRAPFKSGSLDKMLNVQIVLLIIIQLILSAVTGLASWLWRERSGLLRPHLGLDIPAGGNWGPAQVYIPLASLTAWILYSYLVPISLLVTMEIVKLIQGVMYISRDKRLRGYVGGGGPSSGMAVEPSSARNTALNEDLGRVSYVFSDKTGTLTQNDMRVRQLSLRGHVHGQPADVYRMEDQPDAAGGAAAAMAAWDPHLAAALQHVAGSPAWEQLLSQGDSQGIAHPPVASNEPRAATDTSDMSSHRPSSSNSTRTIPGGADSGTGPSAQGGPQPWTQGAGGSAWQSTCDLLDMMFAILTCNTVILEPVEDTAAGPVEDTAAGPVGDTAAGPVEDTAAGPDEQGGAAGVADRGMRPEHVAREPAGSDEAQQGVTESDQKQQRPLISYQGPSPDEVALLEGARQLGFELVSRDKGGSRGLGGQMGGSNGAGGQPVTGDSTVSSEVPEPQADGGTTGAADGGTTGNDGAAGRYSVDVLRLCCWGTAVDVQLLNLLEFTSDRKRMSCVVRLPAGTLIAYVKGADSVMLPLMRQDTPGDLLDHTHQDLSYFASQGLRTLVVGRRVLDPGWYKSWDMTYQEAAAALEGRDERVAQMGHVMSVWLSADELERDLELIGATGIEDRLQDGVPEAVRQLLQCGIKVWMITGDKRETARNIAVSCALFPHDAKVMTVAGDNKAEAAQCITQLLKQQSDEARHMGDQWALSVGFERDNEQAGPRLSAGDADERMKDWRGDQGCDDSNERLDWRGAQAPGQQGDQQGDQGPGQQHLIVDGKTLNHVLPDAKLRLRLAHLAARCHAVLVCRASPAHKAAIVKLMAVYLQQQHQPAAPALIPPPTWLPTSLHSLYRAPTRALQRMKHHVMTWNQQAPVLVAVGDGANDLPMLQVANVGIGLLGREGRQAANAADYVLPQFRCLVPLLLVHGTLCRHRLGRLVSYSFYKNVAFWMILFAYQPFCGWSGQAIVDDVTAAFYNVVFTALPIFLYALLDRPVTDKQLLSHPELYSAGGPALSSWRFWTQGVLLGMAHGAVAFLVPYLSSGVDGVLPSNSMSVVGKSVFVALLGAVTLEIAITTRYWTWYQFLITFLSFSCVLPIMAIIPYVEAGIRYADPAHQGVLPMPLMHTAHFWLSVLAVCAVVMGSRVVWVAGHWLLAPSHDMQLAQAAARAARAQGVRHTTDDARDGHERHVHHC